MKFLRISFRILHSRLIVSDALPVDAGYTPLRGPLRWLRSTSRKMSHNWGVRWPSCREFNWHVEFRSSPVLLQSKFYFILYRIKSTDDRLTSIIRSRDSSSLAQRIFRMLGQTVGTYSDYRGAKKNVDPRVVLFCRVTVERCISREMFEAAPLYTFHGSSAFSNSSSFFPLFFFSLFFSFLILQRSKRYVHRLEEEKKSSFPFVLKNSHPYVITYVDVYISRQIFLAKF